MEQGEVKQKNSGKNTLCKGLGVMEGTWVSTEVGIEDEGNEVWERLLRWKGFWHCWVLQVK